MFDSIVISLSELTCFDTGAIPPFKDGNEVVVTAAAGLSSLSKPGFYLHLSSTSLLRALVSLLGSRLTSVRLEQFHCDALPIKEVLSVRAPLGPPLLKLEWNSHT